MQEFDKGRGPVGFPPIGQPLACPYSPIRVLARVPLSNSGTAGQLDPDAHPPMSSPRSKIVASKRLLRVDKHRSIVRRPRTILTVPWLLTVCDATARAGLPWVGLPTAHGRHGRAWRSGSRTGPPGSKAQLIRDVPRAPADGHATHPALHPFGGASGPVLSRVVAKLIWSTATYLFCRRCSNGGQRGARVAAGQSTGTAAGLAFSLLPVAAATWP
jgi:hypothetical protein